MLTQNKLDCLAQKSLSKKNGIAYFVATLVEKYKRKTSYQRYKTLLFKNLMLTQNKLDCLHQKILSKKNGLAYFVATSVVK